MSPPSSRQKIQSIVALERIPSCLQLDQYALDSAIVRTGDVVGHPVFAEHVTRDFDDDVVRFDVGVFVIARQALQARGAAGQDLDVGGAVSGTVCDAVFAARL